MQRLDLETTLLAALLLGCYSDFARFNRWFWMPFFAFGAGMFMTYAARFMCQGWVTLIGESLHFYSCLACPCRFQAVPLASSGGVVAVVAISLAEQTASGFVDLDAANIALAVCSLLALFGWYHMRRDQALVFWSF